MANPSPNPASVKDRVADSVFEARVLAEATSARVSVKATSNEGMGWTGRGEGIACIAVAFIDGD